LWVVPTVKAGKRLDAHKKANANIWVSIIKIFMIKNPVKEVIPRLTD